MGLHDNVRCKYPLPDAEAQVLSLPPRNPNRIPGPIHEPRHQLRPRVHPEPAQDRPHVVVDRVLTQAEPLGHRLLRESLQQQVENTALSVGKGLFGGMGTLSPPADRLLRVLGFFLT